MVFMCFDQIWWGENSATSESRCFGSMSFSFLFGFEDVFQWSIPRYFFGHCSNFLISFFEFRVITSILKFYLFTKRLISWLFNLVLLCQKGVLSDLLGFWFTVLYVNFTLEWFDYEWLLSVCNCLLVVKSDDFCLSFPPLSVLICQWRIL